MRNRYRLIRKRGVFYFHDTVTGVRESARTRDKKAAGELLFAKNQAAKQPALNVAMARAYLSGKSPELAKRSWQDVMDAKENDYKSDGQASTLKRWQKVCRSEPFQIIRSLPLIETEGEHFRKVLRHTKAGTSTNVWLRILHNYALDMGWLLAPVIAKKVWPKIQYKERRAIQEEEHRRIIEDVRNDLERRLYYELLWETGGSQSDIARLTADRIEWDQQVLLYRRMKTQNRGYEFAKIRIGSKLKSILEKLPTDGFLFPNLVRQSLEQRSKRFRLHCEALGIKGICLHSYRYAWAERARKADVPLRAAMEVLGHQSRAV
ncbi:MAG: tyrosine-type recombinase/integrase, partial [Verrucomicrobiota bacterium]